MADLSAVITGRWAGGQAVNLMGDPQMMWLVDINLLDHSGAGVCTCLAPRQSEWTVVDSQLWRAMPSLAFGHGVDLDAREVVGVWVDSLPGPMLVRTLEYFQHNRKQLEPKVRKGKSLEINFFVIVRAAAVKTMKRVTRTFERGTLPDDGDALHAETDSVPEDFDLDGLGSILDGDPAEWAPGDDDPAPDPLADLDQRRKQHATNGRSE